MKFSQVMGWIYLFAFGSFLVWKFNDAIFGMKDSGFIIFFAIMILIFIFFAIRRILYH